MTKCYVQKTNKKKKKKEKDEKRIHNENFFENSQRSIDFGELLLVSRLKEYDSVICQVICILQRGAAKADNCVCIRVLTDNLISFHFLQNI